MHALIIFSVLVREILNCKLSSNVDIGSSNIGLLQELHIPRTGDLIQILFTRTGGLRCKAGPFCFPGGNLCGAVRVILYPLDWRCRTKGRRK